MALPQSVLFQRGGLLGNIALQPQLGTPCSNQSCTDLVNLINEWTTWAAWLIGGIAVLWVVLGFYKALSHTRLSTEIFKGSPAARMVLARVVEAALIFFIAWRVGAIGQFVETFVDHDRNIGGNTSPTVIGRPIAAIIGYAIALVIQCFLLFLVPRMVFQAVDMLYGILWNASGTTPGAFQRNAFVVLVESIALGTGIVFAPNLVTWLISALT
jgi:hypothetical protein